MILTHNIDVHQGGVPFIVAEISANHGGSLERALDTITLAKEAGASAVKLQTYTPDTITLPRRDEPFIIQNGSWKGKSLYELYEWAHTPFEWHSELFRRAQDINIPLFSTPFDVSSLMLLEKLNCPLYKIASFELTDIPLVREIAKLGKPVIMSTGMASISEIDDAVSEVAKYSNLSKLILLHCVSSYPAKYEDSNLMTIEYLHDRYGVPVGLSDHTLGSAVSVAAVALGACVIEKHFKPSKTFSGPDSEFSLCPDEFRCLVENCANAQKSIGMKGVFRSPSEDLNRLNRRSLYFIKDMSVGEVIKCTDLQSLRPGIGIKPKYMDQLIGMTMAENITSGSEVLHSHIKEDTSHFK